MVHKGSKVTGGLAVAAVMAVASAGVSAGRPAARHAPVAVAAKDNQLVIYGNPPPAQFKPVLDAFGTANPNIRLRYSDQEDNVSFSKYRAEHSQHARTADIIIASSPLNWDNNRAIALNFKPKDAGAYPGFLTQFPGILVLSPDPAVSVYSKAKLPSNRIPHSFTELERYLKKYPSLFKRKIATYTIDNQFGYSAFWGLVKKRGWFGVNTLGPASKPQADGTAIVKQIVTGASNFAFFESGLVRSALVGDLAKVAGWTYMKDFTPLVPRGVAITKGAANPAAAKTFLNWVYSAKGQRIMCAAGFTAFRRGVSCPNSLTSIQRAVGARNAYLVPFHSTIAKDYKGFVARWHRAFG
jgi:iron(III) transport system substrate-binding protein